MVGRIDSAFFQGPYVRQLDQLRAIAVACEQEENESVDVCTRFAILDDELEGLV